MTQTEIYTTIYQNTSRDYYTKRVRGMRHTAEILHKEMKINEDEIWRILDNELSGDYYASSIRGITTAAEKIMKLQKNKDIK